LQAGDQSLIDDPSAHPTGAGSPNRSAFIDEGLIADMRAKG
jgi:hypothetical protein